MIISTLKLQFKSKIQKYLMHNIKVPINRVLLYDIGCNFLFVFIEHLCMSHKNFNPVASLEVP